MDPGGSYGHSWRHMVANGARWSDDVGYDRLTKRSVSDRNTSKQDIHNAFSLSRFTSTIVVHISMLLSDKIGTGSLYSMAQYFHMCPSPSGIFQARDQAGAIMRGIPYAWVQSRRCSSGIRGPIDLLKA